MLSQPRAWDPLYGRVEMTDFEFGLLRLSEVQRLRYVRMCNINSLLVTGASEISRFEHTVGVMHISKEWVRSHGIPDSTAKDIIAAAVLHDMQTGPFGHSMQYVLEDNELDESFVHEDLSHGWRSTYHQEILAGAMFSGRPFNAQAYLGGRWDAVAKIIKGEGPYGPLIAGTMDLDNIDNVVRLAFHVGVADRKDCELPIKLARQISIVDGTLCLPAEALDTVQRWQDIRRRLYELLLLDWAEFSAKAMLTRAIEHASTFQIIGADSWVRTDAEFLEHLDRNAIGEAQEVRELIRRLRRGDLYQPIALLTSPSIEAYSTINSIESKKQLEHELLQLASMKGIRPLIHFILDKGKTDREVKIKLEGTSRTITVGRSSRQLLCGLFISTDSISEPDRVGLMAAFHEVLDKHGVTRLTAMPDPMGKVADSTQSTLL